MVTYRFGRALHFDEAHAAVSGHRKALVVAEPRNLNTSGLASLIDRVCTINLGKNSEELRYEPSWERFSIWVIQTYLDGLSIDVDVELV